jgi:NADPH:quinone reductase-like Zn-dependent oxidoreductase
MHIPNSGNGGIGYILRAQIASLFHRQQGGAYFAVPKEGDLKFLKELIESGKIKPVIDKTFPLKDTSSAFRYMEEVHASGKVLITVEK